MLSDASIAILFVVAVAAIVTYFALKDESPH